MLKRKALNSFGINDMYDACWCNDAQVTLVCLDTFKHYTHVMNSQVSHFLHILFKIDFSTNTTFIYHHFLTNIQLSS